MPRRRTIAWAVVLGLVGLAALPTALVNIAAVGRIHTLADVPEQPVAIVFGAAIYSDGAPSPFLKARLDLAFELFSQGSVRAILVSGDNRRADYNEPDAMRAYLIERGVPPKKVVADYAGFDTYSTCVRAQRIFGVRAAILTSQGYHLQRAVATCRASGVDAWGVGDESARRYSDQWWQGWLREWPANIKLASDLASQRLPVLGEPEVGIAKALSP